MAGLFRRYIFSTPTLAISSACSATAASRKSITQLAQLKHTFSSASDHVTSSSSRLSCNYKSYSIRFMSSNSPAGKHNDNSVAANSITNLNTPNEEGNKVNEHGDVGKHDATVGYYKMPAGEHHGDPRSHLYSDGTSHWGLSSDHFHWYNPLAATPQQPTVTVDGVKMLQGVESRPLDELYSVSQYNVPFWPRMRLNFWGNHSFGLKVEFLFFWIPTFIIASLAVPCLTMIYLNDEQISTTMTVKCIGRQWYWVYEVESPADIDD